MFGKNAAVEVPLGTMVYDNKTGELLADMTQNGQEALIVKGGHGGRGNSHFATSAVRAPLYAEKGEPGEEKEPYLELKVLADVGLLGFPSVGKSSPHSQGIRCEAGSGGVPFHDAESDPRCSESGL